MGVENTLDIKQFKGVHKGERCFILGTGPSLDSINWDLLKDEILIGVNTVYTGFPKFGRTCNYYCISDHFAWLKLHGDIYKYVYPTVTAIFLGLLVNKEYRKSPNIFEKLDKKVCLVYNRETGANGPHKEKGFSTNLYHGSVCGFNVVFDVGLQLAYYMGFDSVYLLGCDTDWSGKSHRFSSGDASPSQPAWGKSGSGKQPPHLGGVLAAYVRAKTVFENDGRKVYNSTPGGKLEIFDRVKLEDLFGV